jgi:hypothetical protein
MSQKFIQLVALVTYGNLCLQNRNTDFKLDKLITDNCYRIDFIDNPTTEIAGSVRVLATDVSKWYRYLQNKNAVRLKLHYHTASHSDLPDHVSAAFVGGGSHWLIEVQYENNSEIYLSEWIPSEEWQLDTRKTHYVRIETSTPHLEDVIIPIEKARKNLDDVLHELVKFAGKFEYSKNWADYFTRSRKVLTEFTPDASDDFLPAGIYSLKSHQLIQAVFSSWCFGGMGSWNDLAFNGKDQELYESLSGQLYTVLCDSLVTAVNTYPSKKT